MTAKLRIPCGFFRWFIMTSAAGSGSPKSKPASPGSLLLSDFACPEGFADFVDLVVPEQCFLSMHATVHNTSTCNASSSPDAHCGSSELKLPHSCEVLSQRHDAWRIWRSIRAGSRCRDNATGRH
jgi:hypothetical protein